MRWFQACAFPPVLLSKFPEYGQVVSGRSFAEDADKMIAVEKADVAFQLVLQVRNKVISAYQEVMRMQM